MLQSLESNYSKDTDSETEQTYEAVPGQYDAAVALGDSICLLYTSIFDIVWQSAKTCQIFWIILFPELL